MSDNNGDSLLKLIEHVKDVLKQLISSFKSDRNRHKFTALVLKMLTAVLAASSVILLGWQLEPNDQDAVLFKNLALLLNAILTIVAAYEIFFRPKILWVRETVVFRKLKDIERNIKLKELEKAGLDEDAVKMFHDEIQKILKDSLDAWIKDKQASG